VWEALIGGVLAAAIASIGAEVARRGVRVRPDTREPASTEPGVLRIGLLGVSVQIGQPPSREGTQERVGRLVRALSEAAEVATDIEQEMRERSALVARLERDVERYDRLAKLKKDEVEAVAELFREEIRYESSRTFWHNVGINFVFFLLGVGVALAVAHWA
jgi:hypothetical protein